MTREPAQFPHNLALKRIMAALGGTVNMRVFSGKNLVEPMGVEPTASRVRF